MTVPRYSSNDMNTTQHTTRRFRRVDLIGVLGLALALVAATLFKSGAEYLPVWLLFLTVPALWCIGFALLACWAFLRVLASAEPTPTTSRSFCWLAWRAWNDSRQKHPGDTSYE